MENWMLDYKEVKRRFFLNCGNGHPKAISFDKLINIVSKYHMGQAEIKKFKPPEIMNYNPEFNKNISDLKKLF